MSSLLNLFFALGNALARLSELVGHLHIYKILSPSVYALKIDFIEYMSASNF